MYRTDIRLCIESRFIAVEQDLGGQSPLKTNGSSAAQACDQPAPRHHVEHRKFLGDANWQVVERNPAAEHDRGRARVVARQCRRHQAGRRHQLVSIGVVLIDAEPVIANRLGEFELIEVGRSGCRPTPSDISRENVRQIGPRIRLNQTKRLPAPPRGPGDNRLRSCCQGLDALNKVGVAKDALRFEKVQDLNK
jgi:hypothetical protein